MFPAASPSISSTPLCTGPTPSFSTSKIRSTLSEKDAARLLVRNALRAVDFLHCERMVRINQLPLGLEDLDEIVPESPDLILIPKVESPDQILEADSAHRGDQSRLRHHSADLADADS